MMILLADMKKLLTTIGCLVVAVFLFTQTAFAAEKVYFYHNAPDGSPLAITDEKANIVWQADYKPFGEEHSVTETIENNKRFITPDPIGPVNPWNSKTNYEMLLNPQGLNPYAYGLNNPYKYVDQDGLFAWQIPFTSVYFYAENRTSPGSRGISVGFITKSTLMQKYPKLKEISPEMSVMADKVILRLEARGYSPRIVEALRTIEQQEEKVRQGFSKTLKSKHLGDGNGALAMDVVDKRWGYDDSKRETQQFFRGYGEIGEGEGLGWGGAWKPINQKKGYGWDPGHLELK